MFLNSALSGVVLENCGTLAPLEGVMPQALQVLVHAVFVGVEDSRFVGGFEFQLRLTSSHLESVEA